MPQPARIPTGGTFQARQTHLRAEGFVRWQALRAAAAAVCSSRGALQVPCLPQHEGQQADVVPKRRDALQPTIMNDLQLQDVCLAKP